MAHFNYRFTRVLLVLFVLSICTCDLFGQKNDYIWLSGYDSNQIVDSAAYGYKFGISVLNFNNEPVSVGYDSFAMNFSSTNTSYCDNDGNLLFYSNGIFVANALNQAIPNSEGLNQGWLDEVWDPSIQAYGYRNPQGIIALPDIAAAGSYYLVYSYSDSMPGSNGENIYTPKILTAYLDMSANDSLGTAVYINRTILEGNLGEEIVATKHGNGHDWWILIPQRNSNCFHTILLSDSGFEVLPNLMCVGTGVADTDVASASFSPDGAKFAQFAVAGGLNIYDFDRCTGELSNPISYPIDIWDSGWLGDGVAFSPNSRFLYVSATKVLLQFDLWAADVIGSVDTVGIFDGFAHPFGSYFDIAQLAPDGKIYISCGNTEADYHVINNPNGRGDSCDFQQHAVMLPTPSAAVPNFPNYRLGVLSGSACDTITGLNEVARAAKEQIIKVYPNPASDYTIVDYGFTDWNKGQPDLEICSSIGQVVYQQQLPMYSGFQKIDVSRFAAGMYTVFIKRQGGVVASQKLVKD